MENITEFQGEKVEFIETVEVKDGVTCLVFKFVETNKKDLGIVFVKAGCSTPLQKVLKGDRTIEGLVSGSGTLTVTDIGGSETVYEQTKENNT